MIIDDFLVRPTLNQMQKMGGSVFDSYADVNDGRRLYINPDPLARWEWGWENATDERYAESMRNISISKEWYETHAYGRYSESSCSKGLYAYIWQDGAVSYRGEYVSAPTQPPLSMDDTSCASYAGAPEVVVPMGEVAYNSTKSMHMEYVPVAMALQKGEGLRFCVGFPRE